MPANATLVSEIQTLRAQAEMYRKLAATLFDRRTAGELQRYALELEAETVELAAKLERQLAVSESTRRVEVAA